MRQDGRENSRIREIKITPDYVDNVPGSVMIEQGKTRLLCTATYEERVPYFLRDSNRGWITAEYAMLPGSTGSRRMMREREKRNSRNIEIQRFIGRALRTTFDLKTIKGFNIFIDTDVLQADGSTRCAAVNCGMITLVKALRHLVYENKIADLPAIEIIAAVSIGVKGDDILADLNYEEDFNCDADINVISSERGKIIEVEAFAEEASITKELFHQAVDLGVEKNAEIIQILKKYIEK